MPRPTNDERLRKIHADAIQQFDRIQEVLKDEREQCLQDRRFYSIAGAQWEGSLGEQFENKPKFEVNKTHLAVIRIFNEYRNNRISVDFVSKTGETDDDLADACDGLFRADEHDSVAEEAYDNAFEEAVGGGMGAIRLCTEYENEYDPDDDRQRIRFEPIYDADTSVWFDLDAKRQDKSDAKYCFVIYSKTKDSFIEEWDEDPSSWPKDDNQVHFDWYALDVVYIAEYYLIEDKGKWRIIYQGTAEDEIKLWESEVTPEKLEELIATGYKEIRRKRVKTKAVHKYILCGNSVLEDCGYIAGENIPIAPNYGKRWFINNIERCMGHVRLTKDAQRLFNMQLSKLGEIAALSPISKPIFSPEQVAGHTTMWEQDNMKNYPFLLINSITGADGNPIPTGPLAYTKSPEIPQANAALLQITDTSLQDMLGNQQEADKMSSNISGKSREIIQVRLDMQTYIYVSNFAKCIRRVAEIWLSMARDVYVEPKRKMKTIGQSEEVGTIELMEPTKDQNTGALVHGIDFNRAKFDVAVTVGPASTTRRQATVRALTELLAYVPQDDVEAKQILLSMIIKNTEGEGMSATNEFFRKRLVKMGAEKPTDEEKQAMEAAAQQPDPQSELMNAMAEEASAKAVGERAKVLQTVANVEKIKSETIKNLADVDMASTKQALDIAASATPEAQQLVQG